MVGSAIESILSSIKAKVTAGIVPRRRGSDWIVYNIISTVPANTKSGASNFDTYRVQIDCYSRTYGRADTLAASVKSAMDEYSGTVAGVTIDHIYFDGEQDMPVEFQMNIEAREEFYRRQQDYLIIVKT